MDNKTEKSKPSLFLMAKIFFKIGLILIGGGYIVLPLLQKEFVKNEDEDSDEKNSLKIFTDEQIVEYFALSQCLPGIIVANTVIFIGYKLRSIPGAIVAIFSVILPAFLIILMLSSVFFHISHFKLVENIFYCLSIGIIILISMTLCEVLPKSVVDKTSLFIFLLCTYLLLVYDISPAKIVILACVWGIISNFIKQKIRKKGLL